MIWHDKWALAKDRSGSNQLFPDVFCSRGDAAIVLAGVRLRSLLPRASRIDPQMEHYASAQAHVHLVEAQQLRQRFCTPSDLKTRIVSWYCGMSKNAMCIASWVTADA